MEAVKNYLKQIRSLEVSIKHWTDEIKEIQKVIDYMSEERDKRIRQINSVEDDRLRSALIGRYIMGLNCPDIARDMGYSVDYMRELVIEAEKEIIKIISDTI